ncbi:hypothetical protein EG329_003964 [Mollisiaceae sp. DMI_Dod_QoI]|nr:hypothetical protein EG329_003964 [Helotiales sp. DMI_Dod_QoI]
MEPAFFSKAVGPNYGVAKRSDVVIVKIPLMLDPATKKPYLTKPASPLSGVLEGYRLVIEHIKANSKQGMAVNDLNGGGHSYMLERYIQELIALDVVVVTASGNDGTTVPHVNAYPAAYLTTSIPQLLVVDSVDRFGVRSSFSQGIGAEVNTYALGEDVICANGGMADYATRSGTSYSAPQVAGLAAYILSLKDDVVSYGSDFTGKVASAIQTEIVRLAYPRKQLNAAAVIETIWNGWEPPGNTACDSSDEAMSDKKRRQATDSDSITASVCTVSGAFSTVSIVLPTSTIIPVFTSTLASNIPSTSTSSSVSTISTYLPLSSTFIASKLLTPSPSGITSTSTMQSGSCIPSSTSSIAAVSSIDCTNTANQVPGQCGVSGCAIMLIDSIGAAEASCQSDYCYCGGTVAPLLTITVSGTMTTNCRYTTQPSADICPPATSITPTATNSATATTSAQSTATICITCPSPGASTAEAADCPESHPDWFFDSG